MGNPFVHVDLSCDDPEAAKKFYKSIFDWSFQDFPGFGGWSGLDVGGGVGGGLGKKQDAGEPTAWTAYVQVDDVKKTVARAQKAGATILMPFMEVPGMGYLAVFRDPQGAQIGLWQTAKGGGQQPAADSGAAQKPAGEKKQAADSGAAQKAPAAKATQAPAAPQKAPPAKAAQAPAAPQKAPAAKATQAPAAPQKGPPAKATQSPSKTPPPAAKTSQAKAPPPNAKATQAPSKAAPANAKASPAKAARPEAPSKAPAKATAPTRKPAPVMGKTGKR